MSTGAGAGHPVNHGPFYIGGCDDVLTIKIFTTASAGVVFSNVVSLTLLDNMRCAFNQATDTGELYTTIRDIPHHLVAPWEEP